MNSAQATMSGTRTDHDAFASTAPSASELAAEPLDHRVPDTELASGGQVFSDMAHMAKIRRVGPGQKRYAGIAALVLLAACTGASIIESSAMAVTVRYGGTDGIDEASELAQKSCAAYHKTARLRNAANFGLVDRYAHFDCI